MGADVRGAGTDVIKLHGVDVMHGADYTIIPDQIEAGTYMVAAAATGGDVLIKNIIPKHMESVTNKLIQSGALVTEYDDSIRVCRTNPLEPVTIKSMPHPGFPTDMQPQITAMLTRAQGTSVITEGVFDNRFRYVEELTRMGANITVDGKVAVVQGVDRLTAAPVRATDLRGGAALMISAMTAYGLTEIEDIYHIERGYEDVLEKFNRLGAAIKRGDIPQVEMPAAL
jgi:UDP-N-acetylglucosamine 1-carboxyvinyltransferase